MGFFKKLRLKLIALACLILTTCVVYYEVWGKHLYIVTAYCNCPICINVKEFYDGRFANGEKVNWGGIAAPKNIPFDTKIELVPAWPLDFWNIHRVLKNRALFVVKDRGGKIRGKHIDIFIPDSMGGHQTALKWGRQLMRIKINGKLAD